MNALDKQVLLAIFVFLLAMLTHEVKASDANFEHIFCETVPVRYVLKNQTIDLPTEGRMVVESHLTNNIDYFPGGRLFANTLTENIKPHLDRSCAILKRWYPHLTTCQSVYNDKWKRQWTPAEGGKIGQGSVGNLRPTPLEEMFSGNFYWTKATKPRPGTKFLASFKDNHVVFVMGFETGPRDPKYLGGLQPEVHFALGTDGNSKIRVARLLDQRVELGPVKCIKTGNAQEEKK